MTKRSVSRLRALLNPFQQETSEPTLSKTIPLLLCVSVIGVFTVVFLRKLFIIDYQLPYPSGAATGVLINGFFTTDGEAVAKKQMTSMSRFVDGRGGHNQD